MNQDESKIYPNDADIYGKTESAETTPSEKTAVQPQKPLISFDEIQQQIDTVRQRFKSAKVKITELEEKKLGLMGEWRDALLSGEEQKTNEISADIDRITTQIQLLCGVNEAREFDDYMRRNGKFMDTVKAYEKQQLNKLAGVKADQEKAVEKFRETRATFLEAARALGDTNYRAHQIISNLNLINQYTSRVTGYHGEYIPLSFFQVDPSEKFQRAWAGGCRNEVYPDPQPTISTDNTKTESEAATDGR